MWLALYILTVFSITTSLLGHPIVPDHIIRKADDHLLHLILRRHNEQHPPCGEALPTGRTTRRHRLTRRQQQVLTLKANGYTTKRTADTLGINTKTVDSALEAIFAKLGASNCPQAVAIGLRTEEIDINDIDISVLTSRERATE